MSKTKQAIGLLSSMVSGGEQHSAKSDLAVREALDELTELTAQVSELREMLICVLCNSNTNQGVADEARLLLRE